MKALGMSFVYAIRGIFYCLHHERNMRIHFVCMAYMYFFLLGFDFFQLSRTQFAIIFLANAAVIMGELINTAVERTVDLHSKGKHPLAKAAKDTAAGAVLVAAIGAVAAGVALLWQPLAFRALYQYYASHPGSLALFAASLVFSFAYIFMGPLKLLGLDKELVCTYILAYSKTKIHTYYIMAHGDLYEYTRKVNKVV